VSVCADERRGDYLDIDRRTEAGPKDPKGDAMSAQTPYLEVDAIGVFPTLLLVMVLVLTALGILAHVAFA
jgi:hypothetical protein